MQIKVFDHWTFREVSVEGDIEPLFAGFGVFLLRPFCFDFASFPGKDKDDAWHCKSKRVMFFKFHS